MLAVAKAMATEGGEGEIRTRGDVYRHIGFQDQPVKPLQHLSRIYILA